MLLDIKLFHNILYSNTLFLMWKILLKLIILMIVVTIHILYKLPKFLKEMGLPDHLTCLLRNLYAGQETIVRITHGTMGWFQIGKGVRQGYIMTPRLFNFYAEYIIRTLGWKKHKLESRLPGEISITSDIQMTPPLWQKVKRN